MKEDILEYYPNGGLKHKITYYDNGSKCSEQYYDQNGKVHREAQLPDYQSWHQNGYNFLITYYIHGDNHNLNNPSWVKFWKNGKINIKTYNIKGNNWQPKLNWNNNIKNII